MSKWSDDEREARRIAAVKEKLMQTDPIQPATDEEVRAHLERAARGAPTSESFLLALIARIDAERARADKNRDDLVEAEAARDHKHAEMMQQANLAVDWMIDARKAQDELAAERAALTESEAVRDRMRVLLDAVAVAVRGPPAPNALHDHARLPDEVAKIKAARDKWEARTVRLADALRTQRKDGLCTTCHEARARAIRAVVAAQWGVALRSMAHRYPVLSRDAADEGCQVMCENIRELAALPTAEQIVDGVF